MINQLLYLNWKQISMKMKEGSSHLQDSEFRAEQNKTFSFNILESEVTLNSIRASANSRNELKLN